MNIAYGKIGTAITFNKKKWNTGHGRCEPVNILFLLADNNPDITFYIVGKSDFSRVKPHFKHNNVIDVWATFDKTKHDAVTWPAEYAKQNNINFEHGVLFSGPTGRVNMQDRFYKKNGEIAKVLQAQELYAGPLIYFLNETKIPWTCLTSDTRYINMNTEDLFNPPIKILTQTAYSSSIIFSSYREYLDKELKTTSVEIPIEKVNLSYITFYGKEKPENEYREKNKFSILLTQANRATRPKLIKECLSVMGDDIEVYGDWDDDILNSSPAFKGAIHLYEIKEKFSDVKYSYIEAEVKNWETTKIWEMIECNTLPFVDENYYRIQGFPEYLYVKSFSEMKEKIEMIERDFTFYKSLKNEVYSLLSDEVYSNKKLERQILHFK